MTRWEPMLFRLTLLVAVGHVVVGLYQSVVQPGNQYGSRASVWWLEFATVAPLATLAAFYGLRWAITARWRPWFPLR